MSATLLLSMGYEPIASISWMRAVTLLTLGKVEVVESYDNKMLRSRTWVIKMPAVVRLVKAIRKGKKQEVKFSRHNILARDGWKCQYCKTKLTTTTVTYDHIVPKSKGGKTTWENIASACHDCNNKKGSKSLKEAGMSLKKKPKKPSWVPVFTVQTIGLVPDEWRSYLYWNTALES